MAYIASGYVATGYISSTPPPASASILIYDNRLSDAIPTASSTTAGGAAINLTDFRPYTSWKPTVLPATVTVDCGIAKYASSLSVFNHDLFTQTATIEVWGSTDNFVSSSVMLFAHLPLSDAPFIKTFTRASYRYWRIRLSGVTLPTLTVVALGDLFELPSGVQLGFDPLARNLFGQTNISEQGLPLGKAILFEQWAQQINIPATYSWIRGTLLVAWKAHLRGSPFLFAFDYVTYPTEIYLVESEGNLTFPSIATDYAWVNLGIKGIALP